MGRAKTPAKAVAARKNAAKATRARLLDQTPEERREQARNAAEARWRKS